MSDAQQPQAKRRGRPPGPSGNAMGAVIRARLSEEQRAAWETVGGADWLRHQLDAEIKRLVRRR